MAEANSANPTPQASPAAQASPAEPGPAAASAEGRRLSAIPGQKGPERPSAPAARPARKGVSRGVFALVVVLLVLSVVGLFVQTQRVAAQGEQIATLAGQVEGLQFQLSAANTQIATYDMQRSLVRSSVADLMTQVSSLAELVNSDPLGPAPPESTEATPEGP